VLPDTLSLGSRLVTEAYHAAVGSLLIEGPGTDNPAAWAPVIAALARARHGPSISRRVEALLAGQQEDGRFAGAEDNGLQADLTAALADYALYSDDPDRWTRILWRPIARSAGLLESTDVGGPSARRVAPALERAAEVASEVGETARAEELRSRVQALSGAEPAAVPIAAPSDASMSELLTAAHAAVLTGTPEDKQRAWQAVQARLASQPLPGVLMSGDSEDAIAAAQLVALIADSVLRSEGDAVHLFPALPAGWVEEGTIARLDSFPSGLGPVKLEAAVEQDGSVSVSIPKAAKLAKRLRVSPPLGTAAGRLRANGKPAPPGVFEAGPPWTLDGEIWSLVLERPPSSGRP